jgi:hypothetical protein
VLIEAGHALDTRIRAGTLRHAEMGSKVIKIGAYRFP